MSLKHIPMTDYELTSYNCEKNDFMNQYSRYKKGNIAPKFCVTGILLNLYAEVFDEESMDKLVMLVSGMLWAIENDGMTDDLAYNTWLALEDFSTGTYDNLFREEDLAELKEDVKTLYAYFDAHPDLKG